MKSFLVKALALVSLSLLAGCPLSSEYVIEIKNTTQNQPFSPVAFISSTEKGFVFELGEKASLAIEKIAEGGDNQDLLQQGYDFSHKTDIVQSGTEPIAPGNKQSFRLTRINPLAKYLTFVGMIVRTNDGFFAEEVDLSAIKKGQTYRINARAWDAGTEANSERVETLVQTGEGFNSERASDVNYIHTHPNVISSQDGLVGSSLKANDRFLTYVASVSIKRVK